MITSRQFTLLQVLAKSGIIIKPDTPKSVHYYDGTKGNGCHLYFLCFQYSPRGRDPDYSGTKYHCESQECSQTIKRINGVKYRAPWHCSKKNEGSEYFVHEGLPDKNTPKNERLKISAGMKLLWDGVPA
jgi:hypothetical protein